MSIIADKTSKIALVATEEYGYELVDVEYVKEGSDWCLVVYIDKPEGINIDDCTKVSRYISAKLDEADFITTSYRLQVSSPGLDRPLKTERDFEKHAGELVEVKLFKPRDGQKGYKGKLINQKNNILTIETDEKEMSFEMKDVAVIKRVIIF